MSQQGENVGSVSDFWLAQPPRLIILLLRGSGFLRRISSEQTEAREGRSPLPPKASQLLYCCDSEAKLLPLFVVTGCHQAVIAAVTVSSHLTIISHESAR